MFLDTLSGSLLGNILTGEGAKWSKIPGRGVMRDVEETIRTGQNF